MSLQATETGACPHCQKGVRFESTTVLCRGATHVDVREVQIRTPTNHWMQLSTSACPMCGKPILFAVQCGQPDGSYVKLGELFWPDTTERSVPQEVETDSPGLASDFREAAAVFPKSTKASAALARRCLQYVLTHKC